MTETTTDPSSNCGHPASELLDFYLNGSLEGDEASTVSSHVNECPVCSRDLAELRSLSEAISTHGVTPAAGLSSRRLVWGGLFAAAAILLLVVAAALRLPRSPSERMASVPTTRSAGTPASGSGATSEAEPLDLGLGTLRGSTGTLPRMLLAPGVSQVRLRLAPPEVPGTEFRIGVLGPGEEEILPGMALPPRDSLGHVTIAIETARLAKSGTYRVWVKPATGSGGYSSYPFEISRPAEHE